MEKGVSVVDSALVVNRLLAGLPAGKRENLLARCETVELSAGTILCQPGLPYLHAYFPLTTLLSGVAKVADHPAMEIGSIGAEGMLGASLVLEVNTASALKLVQSAGSALRVTADGLRHELDQSPALRRTLDRYLFVSLNQMAQRVLCARFHEIEARLARWLLETHDRTPTNSFRRTHQELADLLGVQRSAVTIAAGTLQRRQLISYTRGEITILQRDGLEVAACECYAAIVADYRSMLG